MYHAPLYHVFSCKILLMFMSCHLLCYIFIPFPKPLDFSSVIKATRIPFLQHVGDSNTRYIPLKSTKQYIKTGLGNYWNAKGIVDLLY